MPSDGGFSWLGSCSGLKTITGLPSAIAACTPGTRLQHGSAGDKAGKPLVGGWIGVDVSPRHGDGRGWGAECSLQGFVG